MEIKHKLWIEENGKVLFGHGRDSLLRAIEEHSSLQAAAKILNMSYRAAWGKIRASEARLGVPLVECGRGKAMTLTKEARHLLVQFKEIEKEIDSILEKANRKLSFLTEIRSVPGKRQ
ncbi:MAG: LysR family transcriptional regulator [Syntrophales bacterium]|nr:LysR family transcriptional regulator [Syntrophales bacterium]